MRAKSVSFERGRDPKDTLEIGNKNLRYLNTMFRKKRWFAPLQPIIAGLSEGSIPEKEVVKFIERGIIHYDTRKSLLWYDWFMEDGNIFWDNQEERLMITFEIPGNDYFEYRKVYCEFLRSENFVHGNHYIIHSWLKATQENGESETLFDQSNLFFVDDREFKLSLAINQMSRVVEDTIKSLD